MGERVRERERGGRESEGGGGGRRRYLTTRPSITRFTGRYYQPRLRLNVPNELNTRGIERGGQFIRTGAYRQ